MMRGRRNRRVSRPAAAVARVAGRSTWNMLIWNHTKVWIAVIAGLIVTAVLPSSMTGMSRVLGGWNVAILTFVPLVFIRMSRMDALQLRAHYEEEDPTAPVILLVVVIGAVLSLLAIVGLLSTLKHASAGVRLGHLLLATLTIASSWCVVHTMYTLHYADIYYSVAQGAAAPLSFPGTPQPLFWDFVYFSFTIGVACQTADVATTHTGVRRTVAVHSVVSFVFNLAVLGFAINVSAGLLGNN
jgi:uncharacterized membrane protein